MSSFWVNGQLLGKRAIIEYHMRAIIARVLYFKPPFLKIKNSF